MNKKIIIKRWDNEKIIIKTSKYQNIKELLENKKISFYRANLQWANLRGANLRGANLRGANLREANLQWADLREANLQWANLRKANLRKANLQWANLQWANLRKANLREANLQWADLREANLRGADLDFSAWFLSCKGFDVKCDNRLFFQLLYHIMKLDCDSKEFKKFKKTKWLIDMANKFHRVDECGKIKYMEVKE